MKLTIVVKSNRTSTKIRSFRVGQGAFTMKLTIIAEIKQINHQDEIFSSVAIIISYHRCGGTDPSHEQRGLHPVLAPDNPIDVEEG